MEVRGWWYREVNFIERFVIQFPREGTHTTTQGHRGSTLVRRQKEWRKSMTQSLYCAFHRKDGMRQGKQLGLTSLNKFSGLWAMGWSLVVWYLALGWFKAGEILAWYMRVRYRRGLRIRALDQYVCIWKVCSQASDLLSLGISYPWKEQPLPTQQIPQHVKPS